MSAPTRQAYSEALKHPLWQRKRLEVLESAGFRCERCWSDDRTLHAHHKIYIKGRKPWEYERELLECLCELCHEVVHAEKERLDMAVAQQPTVMLPGLVDAVRQAANDDGLKAQMSPRMRSVFNKLGFALSGGGRAAFVDAQNELQDMLDAGLDHLRGAGG